MIRKASKAQKEREETIKQSKKKHKEPIQKQNPYILEEDVPKKKKKQRQKKNL